MIRPAQAWQPASADALGNALACKSAIRSVLPDAQVVLYGSRARGDAADTSDFDLLAIAPKPVSSQVRVAVSDALYDVELERGILASCLVCSQADWAAVLWRASPLRENIERDGIAL